MQVASRIRESFIVGFTFPCAMVENCPLAVTRRHPSTFELEPIALSYALRTVRSNGLKREELKIAPGHIRYHGKAAGGVVSRQAVSRKIPRGMGSRSAPGSSVNAGK